MEIEDKVNKMIGEESVENKAADSPTTLRAVSVLISEYFFPGGGIWKPMTIKAPNREQAEEIHKAKREPVIPADPAQPEKVAEETNNE